jgi:hypothetical protein
MALSDTPIELESRSIDGIEVCLLWHPSEDRVTVTAHDTRTDETLEIAVRKDERALDVFHHPYAYAAFHGVEPRPRPRRLSPAAS